MANKGDWVLIHKVVLTPDQRAAAVPMDTASVPLEMWVKGHLMQEQAELGDEVKVKTRTHRIEQGRLLEVNPVYTHSFGHFVPELLRISEQVREWTFGGMPE